MSEAFKLLTKEEIDGLCTPADEMWDCIGCRTMITLKKQAEVIRVAREVINKFSYHQFSCDLMEQTIDGKCTCGYTKALDKIRRIDGKL